MMPKPNPGQQVPQRGADRLARGLDQSGVKVVFSLSGNQIMPLYDALIEFSTRVVHARHEAAAVFMAEAFARVSGEVGVALVTAAPGFGNALGALYSASMSEVPLVLLSGDSPVNLDGQGAFQQFDQVAAASPFVKASVRLSPGDDPARIIVDAIACAKDGVPGPVHIALPVDLLESVVNPVSGAQETDCIFGGTLSMEAASSQIEKIAEILEAAERPIILVGPHLFRAGQGELWAALSATQSLPLVVLDSPRGLNDPAQGGLRELLRAADCVFYLGKPVDFTSGIGASGVITAGKIMAVSDYRSVLAHAEAVFGESLVVAEQINAVKTASALSRNKPHSFTNPDWLANRSHWRSVADTALRHRRLADTSEQAIYSRDIIEAVTKSVSEAGQSILVCDGGEFGQWAQAFGTADIKLTNGPSGAIGASLPYAIGAKIARPDARVVAIMGDGTVGFHLAELETAAREQLGITILVGNDSRWNAEYLIQKQNYGLDRTFGCELTTDTRYDLAATGLSGDGCLVDDLSQLPGALSQGINTSRPVCINVKMPGAPAPRYTRFNI
ncbi:MAG: thiamine pyrophosphate-binding protein [Gammaproteobacteria bacterium]|nr:thiamine pyrophosphate-binding protein [Gammaproteobacteria bacterium]